jgi:hypothetical protein
LAVVRGHGAPQFKWDGANDLGRTVEG